MILPVSLLMFRLAAILENLLNLCIAVSRNSVRKPAKGFIILSCELIDDNGKSLRKMCIKICKAVESW